LLWWAPSHSVGAPGKVVIAFHLMAPRSATTTDGQLITFKTRDSRHRDAAIVDVIDDGHGADA